MVRSSTSKKSAKKKATAKKAASKKAASKKKVAKKKAPVKKKAVAPKKKAAPVAVTPSAAHTLPELHEITKLLRGVISSISNLTNTVTQLANGAAIDREEASATVEVAAAPAKPKKPRASKAKAEAAAPVANGAVAAADPFGNNAPTAGNTVTKDQVNAALQEVSASRGLASVKEVLTKFKADRLSSVKEDDFEAFIAHCTEICAEAAAPASSVF